jgi:hypothetical protein
MWENMVQTDRQATGDNTVRFACWLNKAIHTHIHTYTHTYIHTLTHTFTKHNYTHKLTHTH